MCKQTKAIEKIDNRIWWVLGLGCINSDRNGKKWHIRKKKKKKYGK